MQSNAVFTFLTHHVYKNIRRYAPVIRTVTARLVLLLIAPKDYWEWRQQSKQGLMAQSTRNRSFTENRIYGRLFVIESMSPSFASSESHSVHGS